MAGLHRCLNTAVDHGDQNRRAKALPKMTIDGTRKTGATQLVGSRGCQRHNDAGGVRASFHSTKTRAEPCCTVPRVSPTSLVPRSNNTTSPSTPKVSVASTQVVMPGKVESIAVSKVQSRNAPLGRSSRWVGNTWARTAVAALGRSNALSSPGSGRARWRPGAGGRHSGWNSCENTAPDNWRSKVSCARGFYRRRTVGGGGGAVSKGIYERRGQWRRLRRADPGAAFPQ